MNITDFITELYCKIVGDKLGIVQNQWGLITDWDCATANVHDQTVLPSLAQYDGLNTTGSIRRAQYDGLNTTDR